jgi:hypothetical protein
MIANPSSMDQPDAELTLHLHTAICSLVQQDVCSDRSANRDCEGSQE